MIQRYSRPEMLRIWSDEAKYQNWLRIEIAVCEAWAKLGRIPFVSLANIKERASFNATRVEELEKTFKHDVIAFLTCVSEYVGEESRYIHVGLTSSDVLDTSFALQLRDAAAIIVDDLKQVIEVLRGLAYKHKYTPMIGRTHGIHAEPITLGLVFALWYDEMKRNLDRMERARDVVSVGKISGAVGTFANVPPFVEEHVCSVLGLKPAKVSTQIIQRDIHAEYFLTLSIIASTIEKIALQIRHFQRTEVIELEEPFTQGQKGSSAMPHKRNPVLSENLCGLSRLVRSYAISALENIPLWHERDISHSSVERVIGPDATILVDFMLYRLRGLLDTLEIYPENMEKNLWLTRGLIFSEKILLKLIDKGLSREKAYVLVQRNAMKSWGGKDNFKDIILKDEEIISCLSLHEIEECFDVKHDLKQVDYIFGRVFSESE
ncbi:MAG TPA: adenylosuccinate lyase [Thermodesulfobacteriota bacterium]|nr:adenylosuccinate lyase [Thermodesulfobacteriota bacterium]